MIRSRSGTMPAWLLVLGLLAAACGPTTLAPSAAPTRSPGGSVAPSAAGPSASAEATPSVPAPTPTATPTPDGATAAPTAAPTPTPTPAAPTATPDDASAEPSAVPGAADACSGSGQNRDFFVQVASAVSWDVYCAVLPAGWFVETGSYRLAGGGRLDITYAGPGGARLSLSEGAFCADASGCVPAGDARGEAPFADRTGTVVALEGDGTAMVVDRGAVPSWLLVATGVGETQALELAAALALVGG